MKEAKHGHRLPALHRARPRDLRRRSRGQGTRVTVRTVLASLAEGMTATEIVQDFPTLDEEGVRAIIAFAAASAEEDLPVPPAPSHA